MFHLASWKFFNNLSWKFFWTFKKLCKNRKTTIIFKFFFGFFYFLHFLEANVVRSIKPYFCSDFRYESNGIFVLGVGFFFLQTNFDFLTSLFWRTFFISFKRFCCPELKFEKIFHLSSFFVKLWGFKDCHFGQFGTINARYISRY